MGPFLHKYAAAQTTRTLENRLGKRRKEVLIAIRGSFGENGGRKDMVGYPEIGLSGLRKTGEGGGHNYRR